MVNEIEVIPSQVQTHEITDVDVLNPSINRRAKLKQASEIAEDLKDIIENQGLALEINQKKYVLAEGWNTLGSILGVYPDTEWVRPVEFTRAKRAYEARVCIKMGDQVLSTAQAIADSSGRQKDDYAIYSMAQTRAMGKAYRMAFSWIIKLAGYEPTPAEEMRRSEHELKIANAKSKLKREE